MIKLTPFKDDFCQKECIIYSVNNENPKDAGGSMTTSEECPRCKKRHIFRVYEPKREIETDRYCIVIYDCKCPNCENDFEILDIFDKLED
ncbi:hypothetical protein FDA42_18280 [Clostridium botulinum]|nr:hypothetical protein [Clostridium botulinum]